MFNLYLYYINGTCNGQLVGILLENGVIEYFNLLFYFICTSMLCVGDVIYRQRVEVFPTDKKIAFNSEVSQHIKCCSL